MKERKPFEEFMQDLEVHPPCYDPRQNYVSEDATHVSKAAKEKSNFKRRGKRVDARSDSRRKRFRG